MHSLGCQTMTAIYREFVHFIWTLIIRPSLILNTIWSGISDYSSTVINSRMPPTLVWYTNKQSRGTKVLTRICPCDVLLTSAMLIAFFPSIWQYIMSLLNTTRNEKKEISCEIWKLYDCEGYGAWYDSDYGGYGVTLYWNTVDVTFYV